MSKRESAPLACLDANIFLAVLIPEATRAPKNEIAGAARVLKAVEEGHLQGVTTAILFGEIRFAYLREESWASKLPARLSKRRRTYGW